MKLLKINPVAKPRHYQFYFDATRSTASRMYNDDKVILNKTTITFQDFFNKYGGFPCPNFKPNFKELPN